jgi:hypothetical protein
MEKFLTMLEHQDTWKNKNKVLKLVRIKTQKVPHNNLILLNPISRPSKVR